MLNTLFLVDEIFPGESKQYKIADGKYEFLNQDVTKKNQTQ